MCGEHDCFTVGTASYKFAFDKISENFVEIYIKILNFGKLLKNYITLAERNRRKFCASVNDVIGNSDFLSEECVLEIIQKQLVFANINVWCRGLEVASRG